MQSVVHTKDGVTMTQHEKTSSSGVCAQRNVNINDTNLGSLHLRPEAKTWDS